MSPGNCDRGSELMRNQGSTEPCCSPLRPPVLCPSPSSFPQGCFGEGRRRCPVDPLCALGCSYCRLEHALPGLKRHHPPWKEQHRRDRKIKDSPPFHWIQRHRHFYKLTSQAFVVLNLNAKVLFSFP